MPLTCVHKIDKPIFSTTYFILAGHKCGFAADKKKPCPKDKFNSHFNQTTCQECDIGLGDTDNTASHQKQESTKYVIEKISTENSESDIPQILYGHGEFSLTSNLIDSSNQGFNGEYNVNFRACCWDNSVYNLTNPEIKLRRVFRINLSNQVKYQ